MEQLQMDLRERALARRTDPATSRRAAERIDAPTIAQRVVDELLAHGPGTSHELAQRLKLDLVTVSPRMRPLVVRGKVVEDGERDGRTVWRAVGA